MATQTPIFMPVIYQEGANNMTTQKGPITDGSNSFTASSLVVVTSAALVLVATAGTAIYGLSPDGSHLSTDVPPTALFGEDHYPFDLRGRTLVMNATDGTVGHIGTSSDGSYTSLSLAVGQQFGILTPTTGAYTGYQLIDTSNTTQKLFTVVGLHPSSATTDINPRVLVKVIDAALQS